MGIARELGCANRTLEWAREDRIEGDGGKASTQCPCLAFAVRGEGKVCAARVSAVEAPFRLAVAGEVDVERQAGLPIISGRPDRSERLALSMTAPARTRCPGRMHTSPTTA